MEPRIYTYKITFPHQGWWYWGAHKETKYDETYDGSPVTHIDKWEKYEYEKQILEFFDDWDEAKSVEKRLIRPDLNNPLCLNENEGGNLSSAACSKGGKTGAGGKIGGKIQGKRNAENGHMKRIQRLGASAGGKTGAGGRVGGKVQGRKNVENGHLDRVRTKGGETTGKMKFKCLVTGHVSTPGGLARYQRTRGIDVSLRSRVG